MLKIEHGKATTPATQAMVFWVLLTAMTAAAVWGIGRVVEGLSQRLSEIAQSQPRVDGFWQGRTEIARVSPLPDGIRVALWVERGSRLQFDGAYHYSASEKVDSAVTFVGVDANKAKAVWDRGELQLDFPNRHLIFSRAVSGS
jgi:hypothetical protein